MNAIQRNLETRQRVVELFARRDPAATRHATEVFGTPTDPDPTPPDQRYVAPKRVLLEWVGGFSPFDSPLVKALKARGYLTPVHQLVLKQIGLMALTRRDGYTSRTLTQRDGLSQVYRWGPAHGTYVQEVAMGDADRILASAAGHEFRLVGRRGTAETLPVRDDAYWWRVIEEMSARHDLPLPPWDTRNLRMRYGDEEPLRGVDRGGNPVWRAA